MSQNPKEPTLEERLAKLERKHMSLTTFCLMLLGFLFILSTSVFFIGFYAPAEMAQESFFLIGMSATLILSALSGVLFIFALIAVNND